MYEIMNDLPDDVLGVCATGKITHSDYVDVLIPAAEKMMAAHGKIKLLFVMEAFDGAELQAMWDDTAFGLKHWHGFTHIAIVSDVAWMRSMMAMFAPLLPAEVRLFDGGNLAEAKEWLSGA